ncbi:MULTISPECIES: hypothetical protein [Streptomyces]|uniref:hypothetical protein n=1 Tax=Streptomyces TaxID=1883 RepID=UPI00131DBC37|nr:hypothetical protein [Streptomyces sp. NRRL F-5193]
MEFTMRQALLPTATATAAPAFTEADLRRAERLLSMQLVAPAPGSAVAARCEALEAVREDFDVLGPAAHHALTLCIAAEAETAAGR